MITAHGADSRQRMQSVPPRNVPISNTFLGQIEPTTDAFGRYVSGVLVNERSRQTGEVAKEMESREEL